MADVAKNVRVSNSDIFGAIMNISQDIGILKSDVKNLSAKITQTDDTQKEHAQEIKRLDRREGDHALKRWSDIGKVLVTVVGTVLAGVILYFVFGIGA